MYNIYFLAPWIIEVQLHPDRKFSPTSPGKVEWWISSSKNETKKNLTRLSMSTLASMCDENVVEWTRVGDEVTRVTFNI